MTLDADTSWWAGARCDDRTEAALDRGPSHSRSSLSAALVHARRRTMTDQQPTLRALTALRDAQDHNAAGLMWAWRAVKGVLEGYARASRIGVSMDREDALSESLVKVMRGVDGAVLRDESACRAWLRRIFERTLLDLLRKKSRFREVLDERAVRDYDRDIAEQHHLERQHSVDTALDRAHLAAYEEALWNRVDEHIEATVRKHARVNARRRAEVAYERIVRERNFDELEKMTGGEIKRDTLYKWVERGRDDALLPVATRWREELDPAADEATLVSELVEILEETIRADAGRRRARRRDEPPPSSDPPWEPP